MSVEMAVAPSVPSPRPGTGSKHAAATQGGDESPAFGQLVGADAKARPAKGRDAEVEPHAGKASDYLHAKGHGAWRLFDLAKAGNAGKEEGSGGADAKSAETEDAAEAVEADASIATVAIVGIQEQGQVGRNAGPDAAVGDMPRGAPGLIVAEKTQSKAAQGQQAAHQARASVGSAAQQVQSATAKDASGAAPGLTEPAASAADSVQPPGRLVAMENEDAHEHARPQSAIEQGAKVTVLSTQTSPAPAPAAQGPMSATSQAFVQSLGSEDVLPHHVRETHAAELQPSTPRPVTSLKIQLHPAHLGTVTATISGAGEQLAIDVRVENHEAKHRLQTDSDQIVKALRGMGYDIDRITIQQAPQSGSTPGGATSRENAFAAPDQRGGGQQGQSWRQESGQRYDHGSNPGGNGGDRGEGRGSGVYI